VSLRLPKSRGAVRLAAATGVAPSTAGAVCAVTGSAGSPGWTRRAGVIRYEHPAPGELLHADVKKLGSLRRDRNPLCTRVNRLWGAVHHPAVGGPF
jgi:hypothetical protein